MNTVLRTVVGLAVLTLLPLDAQARTIKVKAGESIQTAINAAGDGDTIKVASGTYRETIVVPPFKDRLTIRGGKGVLLDARPNAPSGSGTGITILGDGTTVSGMTVLHAAGGSGAHPDADGSGHGVLVDAVGGRLDRVVVLNALGEGIVLYGSDHEVGKCVVMGAGTGIYVEATDSVIAGTTVRGVRGAGIYASTTEVEITKCRVERCEADGILAYASEAVVHDNEVRVCATGINVNANGARVTSNDVGATAGVAIHVDAQGPVVVGNRVETSSGGGVLVQGDSALVTSNDVADVRTSTPGIQVDSSNATVAGNTVENIAWFGLYVTGFMNVVEKNRVEACGSYGTPAVHVAGDESRVEGNTVSDATGIGMRVADGFAPTVTKNRVSGSLFTGLTLTNVGEAHLEGNKVQNNLGEGIQNFGSQTGLRNNT